MVRWFVTWNDAWVAIGRMQIENQYPPLHHSRTIGGPMRQLEVSKRRKSSILSREYISLIYLCIADLSSLSILVKYGKLKTCCNQIRIRKLLSSSLFGSDERENKFVSFFSFLQMFKSIRNPVDVLLNNDIC